jgi:hypothetical protein
MKKKKIKKTINTKLMEYIENLDYENVKLMLDQGNLIKLIIKAPILSV